MLSAAKSVLNVLGAAPGSSTTPSLWPIVAIVAMFMCAKVAKRETANTKAVGSLGLFFLASALSSILSTIMKQLRPVPLGVIAAMLGLVAVLLLAAIVLAAIGLTECRMQPGKYKQGPKQAGWAIALSVLFIFLMGIGFYSGIRNRRSSTIGRFNIGKTSEQTTLTFEDANCRFMTPGAPWVSATDLDTGGLKPLVMLVRHKPMTWFALAGHRMGAETCPGVDELRSVAEAAVRSALQNVNIISAEDKTIGEVPGMLVYAEGDFIGAKAGWCQWVGVRNGYLYQMMAYGLLESRSKMRAAGSDLMAGFRLIDPERVAYSSASPFGAATSELFKCSLDLTGTPWTSWPDTDKENPESIMAGLAMADAGFLVTPFYYGDSRPSLDGLTAAFLDSVGVDYPSDAVHDLKRITMQGVPCCSFSHTRTIDGHTYDYRMRVVAGKRCGYFVWAWAEQGKSDLAGLSEPLFKRVRLGLLDEPFDTQSLPERLKQNHASLQNSLGLAESNARMHSRALDHYAAAIALRPHHPSYLGNYLSSLSSLGRFEDGRKFIAALDQESRDLAVVQAWDAYLLHRLGKDKEALVAYEALLEKGHRDPEDRSVHAQLLAEKGDWTGVDRLFTAYAATDASLDLTLKKAELLLNHGQDEKSLEILKNVQKKTPLHPEATLLLIENHNAMGDFRSALAMCELMLTNKYVSADLYDKRAQAEYGLKWYAKAKVSLEHAVRLAPTDSLKEDLKHVSGMLGEGTNSNIKDEIPPVPLPPAVAALRPPLGTKSIGDGHGAFFLDDIRGISFVRGKELKSTTYQRIRMLTRGGVSSFSTLEADFDPLSEKVFVNKLVVLDPEGAIVWRGNPSDYYVIDKQRGSMATHDQTLFMPISTLAVGHTVELVYTVKSLSDADEFYFEREYLASMTPCALVCCYYAGKPGEIRYECANGASVAKGADAITWSHKDCDAYRFEAYAPPVDITLRRVVMGDSKATWESEATNYLASISDKLVQTPAVTAVARKLAAAAADKDAKINAILRHVQKAYTYKPIEFGRRARIPNDAATTVARKYGDCKDHAVLVRAMLAAVGIPSHLALVNTDRTIHVAVPSLDQFNHMVLMIPGRQGGAFVDATCKHGNTAMPVPGGLADKKALVLDAANIRFESIPPYPADSSKAVSKTTCRVEKNKDLHLHTTVSIDGYYGEWMRGALSRVDGPRQSQWLQSQLSASQPDGVVLSCTMSNVYDASRALIISADYRIPDCVSDKDGSFSFALPQLWPGYYLTDAPMPDRKLPFHLPYPFTLRSNVEVEVPRGCVFTTAGVTNSGRTASVKWAVASPRTRTKAVIAFAGRLTPGLYPRDEYEKQRKCTAAGLKTARRRLTYRPLP